MVSEFSCKTPKLLCDCPTLLCGESQRLKSRYLQWGFCGKNTSKRTSPFHSCGFIQEILTVLIRGALCHWNLFRLFFPPRPVTGRLWQCIQLPWEQKHLRSILTAEESGGLCGKGSAKATVTTNSTWIYMFFPDTEELINGGITEEVSKKTS